MTMWPTFENSPNETINVVVGSCRFASLWMGLALTISPLFSCAAAAPHPRAYRLREMPPEFSGPVDVADDAFKLLQQRLASRLFQEIGKGGPVGAVAVCRDEAAAVAASVAAEKGIAVGRTGERLRNPANAPRTWARPHVDAAGGKAASQVEPLAIDLGDRIGVLRPIPTAAVCTTCHGAPERLDPELLRTLQSSYPEDRATGFNEGDLRGFFWAEVPK